MSKITIDPKATFESIRLQFKKHFPFLDIHCFKNKHENQQGSSKKSMHQPDTRLSELMNVSGPVSVAFQPTDTVKQFEEKIKDTSGLNVQVFRKSGKLWLETTVTDGWTLQQQNEEGEKSVSEVKEEPESPDDHDMY
jgi:hypothetical protein